MILEPSWFQVFTGLLPDTLLAPCISRDQPIWCCSQLLKIWTKIHNTHWEMIRSSALILAMVRSEIFHFFLGCWSMPPFFCEYIQDSNHYMLFGCGLANKPTIRFGQAWPCFISQAPEPAVHWSINLVVWGFLQYRRPLCSARTSTHSSELGPLWISLVVKEL